jgi:hypothetical protein
MTLHFQSAFDQMMDELTAQGQVSVWGLQETKDFNSHINEQMCAFNIEKQRKTAASEKHAAEIILTA